MTPDGQVYGIVEPRQVNGEWLLALTGTPRHVELDQGELILTSGHGGVFPRGIPIGRVIGQEDGGEAGWQRNYLIEPFVAPSEMTYVLVLGEAQRTLEGQDLALVWGIRPPDANAVSDSVATGPGVGATAGSSAGGSTGSASPQSAGGGGGGAVSTPPAQAPSQTPPANQEAGPGLLGEPIPPE